MLDLTWERQGETIFMRPKDAPLSLLWSFSTNQYPPDDSQIIGNLQWAFRRREVTRCHEFGEQLVFINRDEGVLASNKHIHNYRSRYPLGAAFQLPQNLFPQFKNPRYALLAPTDLVEEGLRKLSDAPNSDFQRATRWLNDYQNEWSNVIYTTLTAEQVQCLLKGLWFIFADEGTHRSQQPVIRSGKNSALEAKVDSKEPVIPRQLLNVFNSHSGLLNSRRERGYSAGSWHNLGQRRFLQFAHETPTFHQKLEALLLWREFLQDKLPESQIESLLPQL